MNRRSILTTLRTYSQRLRAAAFALLCTALMAGGAMAQTVTYFHNDIAGTPQLATNASGAVVWKENYLPYGQRQVAEPASAGNRLWYTGKPHDVDTGLTYMGARYYMPTLGRFTGIDPKAFSPEQPHSLNRYAYGNNNPYKYVDPDGKIAETVWDAFNVSLGFQSLVENIRAGNWSGAAVDGLGLALDGTAMAIPAVPGGAAAGIKAYRAGETVAKGAGEASSLVSAARLRGQLAGQEIAGGHAFEKHVLNQGEFKGLGIRTREQFASHIENVINNPTASRQLSGGRSAYWQESTGTVVIRNPRAADGGTAFQPANGRTYFDGLR